VHNHDISMFDISDIKLYCKDKLSCEDHSVGSEPILKMDNSFLDNTVSSDHNQLAQSSPQVRLDSSEVPFDPISDNTNVDEIDHEIVSLDPTLDNTNLDETDHKFDPCLCETTSTPNTKSTIVQIIFHLALIMVNLQLNMNQTSPKLNIPLVNMCHITSYPSHMHHLYLNYLQFLFLVIYRKLWQILDGPKQWLMRWQL